MKEIRQFTAAFERAVRREMDAMRDRMGPFEVTLGFGERLASDDERPARYRFELHQTNDKLISGIDCTLRCDGGEQLVTIVSLAGSSVVLEASTPLGPEALTTGSELVIYPWFLYERLIHVLQSLTESDSHYPDQALAVFGKRPYQRTPQPTLCDHRELNPSQQAAVQLCAESNVAFVWGPPGTGKTTTLAHIVQELLERGLRVLVTSTTNAAVDQALAKLVGLRDTGTLLSSGEVLRVGRTDEDTYGCDLSHVMERVNTEVRERLQDLGDRQHKARQDVRVVGALLERLGQSCTADQPDLFQGLPSADIMPSDLATLMSTGEAAAFVSLSQPAQSDRLAELIRTRQEEIAAADGRIADARREILASEAQVIHSARLILATLANTYVNRYLAGERFDAVIVEEAGMAVLPAVFYCAALARSKVLLVGDPRQLPPIVQSTDPYVQRAMGRSIFGVTVPEPEDRAEVALLDTQYRMHPTIGDLVSGLYYGGRIRNAPETAARAALSDLPPFPGDPLVLVDSDGYGRCVRAEGSFSRVNVPTAELAIMLAAEALEAGVRSIAIITPYVEQSRIIRRHLREQRMDQVECRTVHRFQGNERDLVILDTVDSAPHPPGVLMATGPSAPHLLNVSISRARGKLIVIADCSYYHAAAASTPIDTLLESMRHAGARRAATGLKL